MGTRSSDVSYGLVSVGAPSQPEILRDHAAATLADTQAGRDAGVYYPQQPLSQYATPVVDEGNIPVTFLGWALGRTGFNVSLFNSFVRQPRPRLYQVFLVVGLAAALLSRRRRFAPWAEFYVIAWAAAIIVAVQVVFPVVSADYGLLRSFQQALIVLCPFVAFGTVTLFRWLGDRWSLAVSSGLVVFLFLR